MTTVSAPRANQNESLRDVITGLERKAEMADNPRERAAYLRAARTMEQILNGGGNEIDDSASIAQVRHLLESGDAHSVRDAVDMVARALPGATAQSIRRDSERLRKKWRRLKNNWGKGCFPKRYDAS